MKEEVEEEDEEGSPCPGDSDKNLTQRPGDCQPCLLSFHHLLSPLTHHQSAPKSLVLHMELGRINSYPFFISPGHGAAAQENFLQMGTGLIMSSLGGGMPIGK